MKKLVLIALAVVAVSVTACGNSGGRKAKGKTEVSAPVVDESTVYVYYFHGKQRCRTCISVENVTKNTIEQIYGDNQNVKFVEVPTDVKANEGLVNKYQVAWNALIVAKGNDHVDMTQYGFANAVNNPQALETAIKQEVDKRLAQ